MSDERARCTFVLREEVDDGHRYTPIEMASPIGASGLETPLVPAVGDVLVLTGLSGCCVVVGRQWLFSSYGSMDWPYGQRHSNEGPMVDVFVERHPGWYADEVWQDDDE